MNESNMPPKALAGRARANLNLRKSSAPEPGTGEPDQIPTVPPPPRRKDEGNPMKKRRRKSRIVSGLILWGLVLAAIGIGIRLATLEKPETREAAAPVRPVAVRVAAVATRTVADRVAIPARIEAWREATVSAQQAGTVVEKLVESGDRVTKGTLMMRIDDRAWRAAAKQAVIEAVHARRELTRWRAMQPTGAVAENAFEQVHRQAMLASNAVEQAEIQVERCRVLAPFDGRIEALHVEVGEFAHVGQPLLRIVNTESLKAVADVAERDVSALREGMAVPLDLTALPGVTVTGTVSFVAHTAHPASRTYAVEMRIEPAPTTARPGMIARAHIERGIIENAVVVPLSALFSRQGETVAFVVDNGLAERRIVRIGRHLGAEVVVESGLRPGDALILEGQRMLRDGTPVEAVGTPAPEPSAQRLSP